MSSAPHVLVFNQREFAMLPISSSICTPCPYPGTSHSYVYLFFFPTLTHACIEAEAEAEGLGLKKLLPCPLRMSHLNDSRDPPVIGCGARRLPYAAIAPAARLLWHMYFCTFVLSFRSCRVHTLCCAIAWSRISCWAHAPKPRIKYRPGCHRVVSRRNMRIHSVCLARHSEAS